MFSFGPSNKVAIAAIASTLLLQAAGVPPATGAQGAANRFALVIGNAKYTDLSPLSSPENDAESISSALKSLGFDVLTIANADFPTMAQTVEQFANKLKKGDVALFYYSGHGVQVENVNYLIPVGASVKFAEDIPSTAIDANDVLRAFGKASTAFNFVILDACRNNDLRRRDQGKVQGLSRMDAPRGTLIAYATGPDRTASDGIDGKHSLYTGELLKVLAEPGLPVEAIFKRVRQVVDKISRGDQIPVEFTSLTNDFYFQPALSSAPDKPARDAEPRDTVAAVDPFDARFEAIRSVALRSAPRNASPETAKLAPLEVVRATGKVRDRDWLRVRKGDGMEGFIPDYLLGPIFNWTVEPAAMTLEVGESTAVREQPRGVARQTAALAVGEKVHATGQVVGLNWLKIRMNDGREGFVAKSALQSPSGEIQIDPGFKGTFETVTGVKLLGRPRIGAPLVAALTAREIVEATGKVADSEWVRVKRDNGNEGYVLEAFLTPTQRFNSGDEFRDCPECPLMVVVPPGSFTMGSTAGDRSERPPRIVTIARKFALSKFEVTFSDWDACVAAGGCTARPNDEGWGRDDRPVINVSWDDAQQYARWLTRKTGYRYHLPSEAQWEYAARGGARTRYAWGDAIGKNLANCAGCGSKWDGKETAPVGSFPKNPFGLHDMHGNAWEWTEDCWYRDHDQAPDDGSARTSGACQKTVLRGGSYRDGPALSTASRRIGYQSAPTSLFGFRIARIIGG